MPGFAFKAFSFNVSFVALLVALLAAICAVALAFIFAFDNLVFLTALVEEPPEPAAWEQRIRETGLHNFVRERSWMWPALETLHFLGLTLLIGTVGAFDLRVLGMGKAISPAALHKLIPIGIAGYAVNAITGIAFFSAFPEQYFYNAAFWAKGTFMAIAGMNVAAFYLSTAFREVKLLPAGADAPFRAKLIAGTSLGAWSAVLICGRYLTFFRPPYFH